MFRNNHTYTIWTKLVHGVERDDLIIDYKFIKNLPQSIKIIIAYYSTIVEINDDKLLANAFGQFLTLKEAQNILLKDWEYNEYLLSGDTSDLIKDMVELKIEKDGNKIIVSSIYKNNMDVIIIDTFNIDNEKILFVERETINIEF